MACGDDDDAVSGQPTSAVTTAANRRHNRSPPCPTRATESAATTGRANRRAASRATARPEPTEESAAVLVGLTEDDATDAAEACGWILRVVRRDGEDQPATLDFRPNRVNVEVTDGEVTAIVNIG